MNKYYYYDNHSLSYLYKICEDMSRGEYRDPKGNWTRRTYDYQIERIKAMKLQEISKEEANKIAKEWHQTHPYPKKPDEL